MSVDWSKYQIEPQEQDLMAQEPMEEQGPINWEKYRSREERGPLGEAGRHLSRIGSRIGETLAGMPGDIVQLVEWVNSKMPKVPRFLEREPNILQRKGREFLENLPSSGELKEKMSELTGGFTDPQGALEEFGDNITELATALTIGKDPTKVRNLLTSIGKATVAKSARKGAEALGAGEKAQFATEIGTLFMMGLMDKPLADKFISQKYDRARELIPEGTMVRTSGLTSELEALEKDLSRGLSTASKEEVKSAISELRAKVSGGAYPVDELVEAFHDINERMTSKRLFDELSKVEKKKLKFRYDKLKNKVTSEIIKYGEINPEFLNEWSEANQGFSTIQNSKKVSSFIESKIGKLPPHVATGMAVELFFGHPQAALITGGTFTGLKTGEMLYRVAKSPALRQHYLGVLKAATEENMPALVKSLKKLDDGLKESFVAEE